MNGLHIQKFTPIVVGLITVPLVGLPTPPSSPTLALVVKFAQFPEIDRFPRSALKGLEVITPQ